MPINLGSGAISAAKIGAIDVAKIMLGSAEVYSAAASDPDFASVQLLLHMDGSNGGTVFSDSSQNGLTVTAYGDAATSTAQAKFGQSGIFDGTGDYLLVDDPSSLTAAGAGDFTYEFWSYNATGSSSLTGNGTLLTGGTGGPIVRYRVASSVGYLSFGIVGVGYLLDAPVPADDQWHHIAICRDSTSTRIYIDGTQQASGTVTQSLASTTHVGIHGNGASYPWQGHLDELRVTIGLARYSGSSYTVPTAAFPDS